MRVALRAVESARQAAERGAAGDRAAHVGYHLIGRGRRGPRGRRRLSAAPAAAGCGASCFAPRHRRLPRARSRSLTACLVALGVAYVARLSAPRLDAGGRGAAPAAAGQRHSPSRSCSGWPRGWCRRAGSPASTSRTGVPDERAHDGRRAHAADQRRRASSELLEHLEVLALGNLDPLHPLRDPRRLRRRRRARTCRRTRRSSPPRATGIEDLNARFGDGHDGSLLPLPSRAAVEPAARASWMGWERKRGKLEEFNRLLRGATDTSFTRPGRRPRDPARRPLLHHARLRHAPAARRGEEAHRHHRASAEPRRTSTRALGRVTEGYGILQPRVSVTMASAAGSLFARTLRRPHRRRSRTRPRSPTPTRTCSAKASSPARASTTSTRSPPRSHGRVPENALLSHDLFEGLYARTALVTDVEVVDDYPSSVLAHARRQHRWVRGDWQILRWLLPVRARPRAGWQRNRLPLISRWKILDNLRRSLMAPATRRSCCSRPGRSCPGSPAAWTARRPGRARLPRLSAAAADARAARGPSSRGACSCARRGRTCAPRWPSVALQVTFLANQAYEMVARDRADARPPRPSRARGCWSGRRPRPARARAGRRAGGALVPGAR